MRITVLFQFIEDSKPLAITGVEDHVTDLLLPLVGDMVTHVSSKGEPFTGTVSKRLFTYNLPMGADVKGDVTVTLFMERIALH